MWRPVIDNERPFAWDTHEDRWRAAGLHRMQQRIDDVSVDADGVVVRTRVAAAGSLLALLATWRWVEEAGAVRRHVDVEPVGEWLLPLPRLGIRLVLPPTLDRVEWYGLGPGESYPDSRAAVRLGRFSHRVAELQTPYVYPQENGHRSEVRWAELRDGGGRGLRVDGHPYVGLTARRWSSAELDAARHADELVEREHLWLHLDLAQNGLGSSSCGPGLRPEHRLLVRPASLEMSFTAAGSV